MWFIAVLGVRFAVKLGLMLARLAGVVGGVRRMTMRGVRMVRGCLVRIGLMMLGRFAVVLCGVLMMLGSSLVLFDDFLLGHGSSLVAWNGEGSQAIPGRTLEGICCNMFTRRGSDAICVFVEATVLKQRSATRPCG